MRLNRTLPSAVIAFLMLLMVIGCASETVQEAKESSEPVKEEISKGEHSGWWCVEHAIPEEVCSMCSASAAKEFKEKGDWCEEHNRAESQCFVCDPTRAEKFSKLYEAKYGKEPPAAIE